MRQCFSEKNVKLLAGFQILLVLFMSVAFSVSLQSPSVLAQQKVCCSETTDGEFCTYTEASNCKQGALQSPTVCEQTSFCKLGCGFDTNEGKCFSNTPQFSCENKAGCQWSADPHCNIPQCDLGCCVLSNECSFTTQLECKKTTSQYPNINMTFEQDINTEVECINQCRSFERGACVFSDGSCSFTTRDSCPVQGSTQGLNGTGAKTGFYPDLLCSHPKLGTECARQQYTGCLTDREEVYWFDSCGNPENIYSSNKDASYNNGVVLSKDQSCNPTGNNLNDPDCGNCNYIGGTLCVQAEKKDSPTYGQFVCGDINCGLDDITQEKTAPASNSPKKVGESWCSFDGVPGYGRDFVGSRHYRRLCINGKELTESCKDFREEMCVQGIQGQPPLGTQESFAVQGGGYVEAGCRDNRFQDCTKIKKKDDCGNLANRDCVWLGPNNQIGKCVPIVPPGLNFWGADSQTTTAKTDAKETCNAGNTACKVVYQKSGVKKLTGGDWKCVANCECKEKGFLQSANNLCKSLGDCGAWFNIAGRFTNEGFVVSGDNTNAVSASDVESYNELKGFSKSPKSDFDDKFRFFFQETWFPLFGLSMYGFAFGLYGEGFKAFGTGFMSGGSSLFAGLKGLIGVGPGYDASVANTYGTFGIESGQGAAKAGLSKFTKDAVFSKGTVIPAKEAGVIMAKDAEGVEVLPDSLKGLIDPSGNLLRDATQTEIQDAFTKAGVQDPSKITVFQPTSFTVHVFNLLNILLTIWTIYNLIDIFLAGTKTETVSAQCLPWVAPTGGNDCELCGKDGKECSEYRCRSLGQMCKLLNAGTKNEKCVNSNPNDKTSPIVRADNTVLEKGFTITEVPNQGFTLDQEIPPFSPVTLGIATDEPSQCKFSLNHSMKFDGMTSFFGGSLFDYNHTEKFSLPGAMATPQALKLTNGGKYTLYVRCQDGNANMNNKDYYIKFAISKGPDLTPPVIETTSIANGGYVPAGINQTALSIYVSEPSECKWDVLDGNYDDLANTFSCTTSAFPTTSIYHGLYDCTTLLKGIKDKSENIFYFRCKDQPGQDPGKQNEMKESYVFKLKGTDTLQITSIEPSGELFTPSPTLKVVTAKGAQGGLAVCGFAFGTSDPSTMVAFLKTNSTLHEQPFTNLTAGNYHAFINCQDVAGNMATGETQFTISVDTIAPQLIQIFTEGTILHITMDEPSSCEYSTKGSFTYGSGIPMTGVNVIDHELSIDSDVFYISCSDTYVNIGSYVIKL